MKGARSNRVVSTEPPDDWDNDSWTVDCICGVSFDDGEEMVDCDDCGVWVHTRCSRFVKAHDSFACHKCKSKRRSRLITDAEETEVAQLLVELPTKTPHHNNNNNNNNNNRHHQIKMTTIPPNTIRPYRLWTERPLQERVHVQGVPGGDPSLFTSTPFPLLINSHIWKSSGYIPKHFNFCYFDFPCLDNPLDPKRLPDRSREVSKDRSSKKKLKAFHKPHKLPVITLAPKLESNTLLPSSTDLDNTKRNAATADAILPPRSPEDTSIQNQLALDHTSQLHKSGVTTLHSFPSPDEDVTFGTLVNKEEFVLVVDEIQTAHSESPTLTVDMPKSKLLISDSTNAASKLQDFEKTIIPLGAGDYSNEAKLDAHFGNPKMVLASHPAVVNIKSDSRNLIERVVYPDQECKVSELSEGVATTSKPLEKDEKDSDTGLEAVIGSLGCQLDKNNKITDSQCSTKLESEGSGYSMRVSDFHLDSEEVARVAGHTQQISEAVPPPPPSHYKLAFVGKSSSTPPAIVFSRSHLSGKSRSGGSKNPASVVGNHLMSNSCVNAKKELGPVNLVRNEDKHDKPMSTWKDNSKPCSTSSLKGSQPSKTVLKYYASAGKDSLRHSSSKVSSVDSSSISSTVSEPAGPLQCEHEQKKDITFRTQQRGEKVPLSNFHPSSKSNQSSVGHPTASSSSPAGLSDEELALLLHQELNSSPRVPRVPRVRQAGGLPQLSSATTANILMKRTCNSGGKDTFSRKKSRDALKDGSHNSREQDSEANKVDGVPSSPDSLKKSEAFAHADGNTDSKVKNNREKISSSAARSGLFCSHAAILKSSPSRVSSTEDDPGANKKSDLTYRTLPGLIAEIMGTGRRMTYEELCNAVLPHWPNLRKHNGERYAYSSHSQAVLDCLRNRTEWARLVDRGPKTSSSRKKRKIDAEPLSSESEDDGDRKLKKGESKSFESNKEDFPKGRRKARRRRRVAPQGKSVKDGQKKRKVEVGSSCDSGSFSSSSDDTAACKDDSQGSQMDVANAEVSQSSDEVRDR